MQPVPVFDELHAISDLHMGGVPGFQIFDQGELLAKLIDHLRDKSRRKKLALVINGDAVDFLAEPEPRYFDADGAIAKLQRISTDPAFQPVWEALRRFISVKNRTLVINLGNHDLELALPWVREWLLTDLSGGDERARGRIRLVADGTGFLCQVRDARVLCVHGNEVDNWNLCDYESLRQQGRDTNLGRPIEPWVPNAGTKLVIDVMNQIKRNFPFVDLLKPELDAVVPTLYALNPAAKPTLADTMGIALKLSIDRIWRLAGFRALTSPDPTEAESVDGGQALDELLSQTFSPSDESTPRSMTSAEPGQRGFLDAAANWFRGKDKVEILREALERVGERQDFDLKHADGTYHDLDRLVGRDVDFVLAGHTHLRRALKRRDGDGFYYNSGTWVRLMRLTADVLGSPQHFRRFYDALAEGTMAALDRTEDLVIRQPTVVSITAERGAVKGRLCQVSDGDDGLSLQAVDGSEFRCKKP